MRDELLQGLTDILDLFAAHRAEKPVGEAATTAAHDDDTWFSAKYLTSHKLFQLQLADVQFRRYFLVQCMIVFEYILNNSKTKEWVSVDLLYFPEFSVDFI